MSKVKIMGILNLTPDSFSDGGIYYKDIEKSVKRVKEMLRQGADIIDIGGESTRPGSDAVSVHEEMSRTIPIIIALKKQIGGAFSISIDTNKYLVAKEAIKEGAEIVNSLGGTSFDSKIIDVVSQTKCQFIIYHIKGLPRTMQIGKIEYDNVVKDILTFFQNQIDIAYKNGVEKSQLIIDPGIGFGKTLEQNLEIIKRLDEFLAFDLPILIGISRKSHLGLLLKSKLKLRNIPNPKKRIEATLAETAVAIIKGATLVRTHDVLQTRKFIAVLEELV